MTSLSKTLRALFLGVALVSLMVASASFILLRELQHSASPSDATVSFEVSQGDSTSTIATKLRAARLIRQPLLFSMLVRSQHLDGTLQSGKYLLRPNMTMGEIIATLRTNQPIEEKTIQVIEGLRLEEIANVIGAAQLKNVDAQTFLNTARNGDAFKSQYFLLNDLPQGASLEGYLFPDTYRFASTATVTDVVTTMLDNFATKYGTFDTAIQVDNATVHRIVTMASIVQREAALQDEMPKIAAVFWNRLKPENAGQFGGGLLGADPTVQYILGTSDSWWPKLDQLTADQINATGANTPLAAYNTRAAPGLPPGPISTPGLAALQAAAQPDQTAQYLYFVASCATPGAHNFATNNDEFLKFQDEYLNCPKP